MIRQTWKLQHCISFEKSHWK